MWQSNYVDASDILRSRLRSATTSDILVNITKAKTILITKILVVYPRHLNWTMIHLLTCEREHKHWVLLLFCAQRQTSIVDVVCYNHNVYQHWFCQSLHNSYHHRTFLEPKNCIQLTTKQKWVGKKTKC